MRRQWGWGTVDRGTCQGRFNQVLKCLSQISVPSMVAPLYEGPSLWFDIEDEEDVHGLMGFIQRTTASYTALVVSFARLASQEHRLMHIQRQQKEQSAVHAQQLLQKGEDLQSTRARLHAAVEGLVRLKQQLNTSTSVSERLHENFERVRAQYELSESNCRVVQSFYDDAQQQLFALTKNLANITQKHDNLVGADTRLTELQQEHKKLVDVQESFKQLQAEYRSLVGEPGTLKAEHQSTLLELAEQLAERISLDMLYTMQDEKAGSRASSSQPLRKPSLSRTAFVTWRIGILAPKHIVCGNESSSRSSERWHDRVEIKV